jgi:ParB/RepB/Spo0J family partition protein
MSHTTAETLLASAANENIPVSLIVAGLNDRTKFNPVDLKALADNIEAVGLAQPPLYRRRTDGRYQIIAGERRTRAMRDVLGWQEIPARVVECDDMTAVSLMGAENRNRVNLDPMDDARSYQNVMALYGWDVAECARRFGVNTRVVKDRVALLALCDEAQDLVSKGENGLTLGYALVLALAGLDRNFQNQALDLLKLNKAPTLDWFRGIVAELQSKCNQNMMWNPDDFMVMAQAVEAQNEAALPDPDIAEAPTDGATPIDVLTNQAAWWLDLAAQWQLKNKAQARVCRANARSVRAW